jgi:ABC transport system ATP-binding/permease protein
MRDGLDEEATLGEFISPGSDWIEVGSKRTHVMTYLTDFLFTPERANAQVKMLSGGERNRLLLARHFAKEANVLVLDEPTNDLDIDTLELLEDKLASYDGTVFIVSHDRRFLDNVVTSCLVAEGDGVWREYEGGITDWQAQAKVMASMATALMSTVRGAPVFTVRGAPDATVRGELVEPQRTSSTPIPSSKSSVSSKARERGGLPSGALPKNAVLAAKQKLNFKEQRELDTLPATIEALEKEQAVLNALIADGSLFQSDVKRATEASKRIGDIDELVMQAMERWEMLASR